MNVALYARVSSEKQDVELSISAQLRALREYVAKNGYEVVKEFTDEAESGRTSHRRVFQEMISLARVGCQRNWTLLRPRKPKRLGVVEAPSEG